MIRTGLLLAFSIVFMIAACGYWALWNWRDLGFMLVVMGVLGIEESGRKLAGQARERRVAKRKEAEQSQNGETADH